MQALLNSNTELLGAAIVAAVVAAAVSFLFRMAEVRRTLESQYAHEQRRKLREVIGRYHGRLLFAANSFNYRMWNLYTNEGENWLALAGDFRRSVNYYFQSFVYRFLHIGALIRQFEAQAIYVDRRIARRNDERFLNYAAAIHWCITDVTLFRGLPYDSFDETDHFFSDTFRQYCEKCLDGDEMMSFQKFKELIEEDCDLDNVLAFFDGLRRREIERYRWDRLVALHLLLMAFVNNFGYRIQQSSQVKFTRVANELEYGQTAKNLLDWLPRHGLGKDRHSKKIRKALNSRLRRTEFRESDARMPFPA